MLLGMVYRTGMDMVLVFVEGVVWFVFRGSRILVCKVELFGWLFGFSKTICFVFLYLRVMLQFQVVQFLRFFEVVGIFGQIFLFGVVVRVIYFVQLLFVVRKLVCIVVSQLFFRVFCIGVVVGRIEIRKRFRVFLIAFVVVGFGTFVVFVVSRLFVYLRLARFRRRFF